MLGDYSWRRLIEGEDKNEPEPAALTSNAAASIFSSCRQKTKG